MRCDTVIRDGLVVLPEREAPLAVDVAITDGKVRALLERGSGVTAQREFRVPGRHVLPGAIDPHVHVSWPYLDARTADDYAVASRAAAAGGTTSFIDFAIEGRESPLEAIQARQAQAKDSVVDFSLHCVVSTADDRVLRDLSAVVDAGVTSFKCYMTYRNRGLAVSDETLKSVAERVGEIGGVLGVHAEDADLDDSGTAEMREAGNGAARYLPRAKPPIVEARAIERAARIAAHAGTPLWILHLSSADGLQAALRARARFGQPLALETCPHYLLLDEGMLETPRGQRWLCSPPLRRSSDQDALWKAAARGRIDWIGTDHCLFLAAQKDCHRDAFWSAPHGLPGIQTRPGLILAAAAGRGIALNLAARLLSANAARWFGLYPRKGTLIEGTDADLAVWDLSATRPIRNTDLHMGGDWTPFEGLTTTTEPELVMVRGEPVAGTGITPASGHGRFIEREPRPVVARARI